VPRNYNDWLAAYVDYASYTEAPRRMHFWSGVSAVAGALRRHVWIDQRYFKWHANQYIVLVAPPGVVAKSTTVSIAMSLLRKVPGVRFGPDVATWQALVKAFAEASEVFELGDERLQQSALTLESSEMGNLIDLTDRQAIDLLTNLWDGKDVFDKRTKGNGSEYIHKPWINIIACTTPAWIAANFPESAVGGGFTSRCLFVYADAKDKLIAYPARHIPDNFAREQLALIQDLEHIATLLVGEYVLSPAAIGWGERWYEAHWQAKPAELDDDRFAGYLSRKQTHIHKTAMVLAAARHDRLVIEPEDLGHAAAMVSDLERDMRHVFDRIGRTQHSLQAERFISYVLQHGLVPYADAYRHVHTAFPNPRDFDGIARGAAAAGLIELIPGPNGATYFKAAKEAPQQ
jgi:hypothetical protein